MANLNDNTGTLVKLEAWLQYNGGLASQMQSIGTKDKAVNTDVFLAQFKIHLSLLGLSDIMPSSHLVVWGTGQMRYSWSVRQNSVSVTGQSWVSSSFIALIPLRSLQFQHNHVRWLMRVASLKFPTSDVPL